MACEPDSVQRERDNAYTEGQKWVAAHVMHALRGVEGFGDVARQAVVLREVESKIVDLWRIVFPKEPYPMELHPADVLERCIRALPTEKE